MEEEKEEKTARVLTLLVERGDDLGLLQRRRAGTGEAEMIRRNTVDFCLMRDAEFLGEQRWDRVETNKNNNSNKIKYTSKSNNKRTSRKDTDRRWIKKKKLFSRVCLRLFYYWEYKSERHRRRTGERASEHKARGGEREGVRECARKTETACVRLRGAESGQSSEQRAAHWMLKLLRH